ncbi:membrane protein [Echinicola pacifica]|uniref:Membrane protein n=1 Tax=Echinicola pacifica TaxID=346377 RepID=A0A918UW22_9BACT|nr:RagB/SusD family nutrient uptake outer membrane protein [Echinicola pacifica]GGZ38064.1 membrane protein [Echinicola pacifica]
MTRYIIVLFLSAICFSSCNDDLLDTKPLDKYTELDVWNDVNLAQGFIYNTYASVIPELMVNPGDPQSRFGGIGNDDFTDNVLTRQSNNIAKDLIDKYFDAGWSTNNSYYFFGKAPLGNKAPVKQNSFEVIRDCNLIIEQVQASEGIPANLKPGLIAQGKMLRALMYFSKARIFGKYIIVDKVLTPEDDLELPRSATIKDTYDFIVNDLQEAAVDLPSAGAAEKGQLTQGAAYAMLAEVALHGAAYIETGQQEYYQIAKQASEDLFGLGYALDADYDALFNDFDHAFASEEIILGQFKNINATWCQQTLMQGLVPNMEVSATTGNPGLKESFLGWTEIWPTHDLIADYLVADVDGTAKRWDETSYFQDFQSNGGYLSEAIYNEARDDRFEASILYDSTYLFSNLVTTRVGGNLYYTESTKGTNRSTPSGYFMKKFIYDIPGFKADLHSSYAQALARLGRSYLNYAEVMLRLNDIATAVEYINKTRVEHGGLPALSAGISLEEAWEYYKIERRVELFFENDRYWSLLRWGLEEGGNVIPELNDKQYKFFEISEDGKAFEIKNVFLNAANHKKRFSPRRYLFPVPENERVLNQNLDQNPGW